LDTPSYRLRVVRSDYFTKNIRLIPCIIPRRLGIYAHVNQLTPVTVLKPFKMISKICGGSSHVLLCCDTM